jgi:fructose-1,6-bisphosphatase/inositol monophosphatase family enzyme
MVPHPLTDAVTHLMRRVGAEIVMPRFRQLAAHEISDKTPGDPVTIVDHESEAFLSAELPKLLPGSRVIGEEGYAADPSVLDRIGQGHVWIIDPLDGTKNFSGGHEPFAIMIGLALDGEREAGWILDPVSGRICHARQGDGAFIDGEKIMARRSSGALPTIAIPIYFLAPEQQNDIHGRAEGKLEIVNIPRCAGEQYPRLVLGQNDIALFQRTHMWDHAAGALILEEAGGKIARSDGTPYKLAEPGHGAIAAASPELWDYARGVMFG